MRDSAQSHQSAQAGRTPKDYYTAAHPVLPLCGAWQYLLIKDQRGRPLYFNTEADDRIDFLRDEVSFSLLSRLTALPCITGIDDDIHVGAVHQVFQDAKLLLVPADTRFSLSIFLY